MSESSANLKWLNVVLWVFQVILALMFGMAGIMKGTASFSDLAIKVPWTVDVPHALTRFIASCEFLGSLGLLLPSITKIKPWLTPLAAAGISTIMILAIGFHVSRGEYQNTLVNIILGSAAAFIAWGRFKKVPLK